MKHPEKWRETIDVSSLSFRQIRVIEILGYPHAGNDVFHVKVLYQGNETNAYIKVERHPDADVANEVMILSQLTLPFVPEILDYSLEEPRYIVTKEAIGKRLSMIVSDKPYTDVLKYLHKQAIVLSEFHNLQIDCAPVKDRGFFHVPSQEHCDKHGLDSVRLFLVSNEPKETTECFVHGDFHYANILWNEQNISCVLDYELSGIGVREFDMAWSVFPRPGQNFQISMDEVDSFLERYSNSFNRASFFYYYVLIGANFYPLGDEVYRTNIKEHIKEAIDLFYQT